MILLTSRNSDIMQTRLLLFQETLLNQWDTKYNAQPEATSKYRSITDGWSELGDDNFVNLSHNMFHKPQVELHWNYNLKDNSILRATAFWSAGRGGGSSINSAGTMWRWINGLGMNGSRIDTLTTNLYNTKGYLSNFNVFDTVYSKECIPKK